MIEQTTANAFIINTESEVWFSCASINNSNKKYKHNLIRNKMADAKSRIRKKLPACILGFANHALDRTRLIFYALYSVTVKFYLDPYLNTKVKHKIL